jgi:hypothetical protein
MEGSLLKNKIQQILDKIIGDYSTLQYIVFIPMASPNTNMAAYNEGEIKKMIDLHGLDRVGHRPQSQIKLWNERIAAVARFYEALGGAEAVKAEGISLSPTRLVLDVEVGGLFYTTVGSYGWLFAATLDQQPLNSGLAEQHLIRIRDELLRSLKEPVAEMPA